MKAQLLLGLIFLSFISCHSSNPQLDAPAIIPQPAELRQISGSYKIPESIKIWVQDDELQNMLQDQLSDFDELNWQAADRENAMWLVLVDEELKDQYGEEAYSLKIDKDNFELRGASAAGVFYGVQSLKQMLLQQGRPKGFLPLLHITDYPQFAWRGMHLDVSRHFFDVEFVKKYIDLMSFYKMNSFHWHLTEDQGWRIEIKKYPKLTEIGAWRDETLIGHGGDRPQKFDGIRYGGFYTQDQIKEVLIYAAKRYVNVVPEIELPGHATAALFAYPEFSNDEGPKEVTKSWGVFDDIFSPEENTFQFLEDVLNEVMDLFPGKYIHIGGDEVPKTKWKQNPRAQAIMKREGLKNEEELQSWFIRRVEKMINARDRKLVGWDEILEGGLSPTATVMSWRGEAGGIEAARHGNDVVMSPGFALYFDHYQGNPQYEPLAIGGLTTLERVYQYHPLPPDLNENEQKHILGAQANVWTEYIKTSDHVEYMVFPRLQALSEMVWTAKALKNYPNFLERMKFHYAVMEQMNVNFRVPEPIGLEGTRVSMEPELTLELTSPMLYAQIRYTLDGSDPGEHSLLYEGPMLLEIPSNGLLRVKAISISSTGRKSAPAIGSFQQQSALEPLSQEPVPLQGLKADIFKGRFRTVRSLFDLETEETVLLQNPDIPESIKGPLFGLRLFGIFKAPVTGIYEFALESDDGSMLMIGGREVVDHDGLHGASRKSGQVALQSGLHELLIFHFDAGGAYSLKLLVKIPGEEWRESNEADWH